MADHQLNSLPQSSCSLHAPSAAAFPCCLESSAGMPRDAELSSLPMLERSSTSGTHIPTPKPHLRHPHFKPSWGSPERLLASGHSTNSFTLNSTANPSAFLQLVRLKTQQLRRNLPCDRSASCISLTCISPALPVWPTTANSSASLNNTPPMPSSSQGT